MKANVHLAIRLLALGLWLAPSVVEATIGLRGAAQAGTATTTLTITKPTGTVQNDVMVASIAFRPLSGQFSSNITVTDPPGWTRLDFFNNTSNYNALAIYYRVAGASEPASYAWGFACNASCTFQAAAGGILTFSGVNTTTPIDRNAGVATSATYNPLTPAVTTTVANAMLVTSHAIDNNDLWQNPPPSLMTQAFQQRTSSQMIQVSWALQAAAASTGQKRATDLGPDAADVGHAHILALTPCTASADAGYVAVNAQSGQATVYWSSANPVLVLRKVNAAFTGTDTPADGTTYATNGSVGGATVIYDGATAAAGTTCTSTSCTQTGLTNGTTYYYKVFANTGSGGARCYAPGTVNTTPGVTGTPASGAGAPAWSYMLAGGSILKGGTAGTGTLYATSNASRIVSLNTADGTQSWVPAATNAPIQAWLIWFPVSSYQYRQRITATAGSAAVPSGYSVPVTFDHASLVTAGKSQAGGADVRVVYWNGTAWVELDRVLDSDSAWNSASTKIWFKTQAAIGASASDNNYYLHYGNSGAVSPPANPNNVYVFYDDFAWSDAPSNHGWTVRNGTWSANGTVLTSSGTATEFGVVSHSASSDNAIIEARVRGMSDVCADCRHTGVGLRFSSAGAGYVGIGYDYDTTLLTMVGQTAWQSGNSLLGSIAQTLAVDTWHRIKFQAIGTSLSDKAWVDGQAEPAWQLTVTNATYASGTEIALFGGYASPKHSEFDWVKVRKAVSPEPGTARAAEEVGPVGQWFDPSVVIGVDQGTGAADTGTLYSVDPTLGTTNWQITLTGADQFQAAVAAQVRGWSSAAFQAAYTDNVIFAATLNTQGTFTTSNKVFARKASDGGLLWTFSGTVDGIAGMPYVDYARDRLYVASLAGSGGGQQSLWVIKTVDGEGVLKGQAMACPACTVSGRHFDTSPTLSYDGNTLYLGDTAGNLHAINAGALTLKWTLALGTAVKGFVWEDPGLTGRLYFTTADGNVRCYQDNGGSASACSGWTVTNVPGASTPVMLSKLFVGSWDPAAAVGQKGKLYQINLTTGAVETSVPVGDGEKQVGEASSETGNEVFVGTTEGKVFKFTLTGGSL